jgi:hypothetical protein
MNTKMKLPSGYIKPYRVAPPVNKPLNKSWSEEEIKVVLNQARNKRPHEETARKLNRPVSDIKSKLKVLAADMYLKDKLPYPQIHDATGVEKDTLILTPSMMKSSLDSSFEDEPENYTVDVSIYHFDEVPDKIVNVDIKDNTDEMIITVSVESPFSPKSICEHLSTPIFSTCARFVKTIIS